MTSTSHRKPRLTSVTSILTAALGLIEAGWVQFQDHRVDANGKHSYCSRGAIQAVSRSWEHASNARNVLTQAGRISDIIMYNDRKSTTKAMVVAKFRAAIARSKRV